MVAIMAEKKKKPGEKAGPKREKTTFRIYKDTAEKISELACLKRTTIHDLIDDMFKPLIDASLIDTAESRAKEVRSGQRPV